MTGKPILANDPHLELSAPILWYLARIVTPEGWVKGATVPGSPVVLLGQNDKIAWGFTTADTDTQDLFVETLDPANAQNYLTPDGPKPFDVRDETIRVKGGADVALHVRSTRHGPVLSDIDADLAAIAGPGKAMALAFVGLGDRDTTFEAEMRLDGAQLGGIPRCAEARPDADPDVVYADVAGDIGYFSPGLVPLRKSGDGLRRPTGRRAPTTGSESSHSSNPQLHNPEVGFAFNANNANMPDDHQPTFGRDWEENFRARRIQQFFDTIEKHSLDTSAAMQADRLSLAARELLPFLRTSRRATSGRARRWPCWRPGTT